MMTIQNKNEPPDILNELTHYMLQCLSWPLNINNSRFATFMKCSKNIFGLSIIILIFK